MKLKDLFKGVDILQMTADPELEITGVCCDSRLLKKGEVFVAISGYATDGNRYIPMAMEKGAAAVVTMKKPELDVPYVLVAYDRMAMAAVGTNFYGCPAQKLKIIGVTGTNGKTSVTWLLKQVLEKTTGSKVGLIGTVENDLGNEIIPSVRTTPQSIELQAMFARMVDAGCQYAVMEVSSHAIDQDRSGGIHFAVAAFTNLTQDHLDYHKTMENYCRTKAEIFHHCDKAVVNYDDSWYESIIENSQADILTTSAKNKAGIYAENVTLHADGVAFTAVCGDRSAQVQIPIPGKFTVYNVLTVLGCAVQLGISLTEAAEALKTVKGVKGRVEVVSTPGKNYTVLIDYAHTPDSLENVLASVRDFCKGRLIAVFGCGGDRDTKKRPLMGGIGVRLADLAVITSDNPRTEAPMTIISDVVAGVGTADNYVVRENRADAIKYAMDIAKKDDIIVLAGKGHETYVEIMGIKHHFDEREVVASCL